jgi:hypothetical protein
LTPPLRRLLPPRRLAFAIAIDTPPPRRRLFHAATAIISIFRFSFFIMPYMLFADSDTTFRRSDFH